MAIYKITVRCNDVTPSETLNDYVSARDFSMAMRLGIYGFEDREIEAFSCEELSLKDVHLKLMQAVVNESNEIDISKVLSIAGMLIDEVNYLKSQLSAKENPMEDDSDCAHDNANKDIYELGYEDGINGTNARDTINPKLQHVYDRGFVDGQNDKDDELSEDNNAYDRASKEGYFDGFNGRDKCKYDNPAHQFVYNHRYIDGEADKRSKWY